jgi:nitronate monooxygenase
MKAFSIGNLKVNLPIVQGGMGVGISLSGLAAAIANEGGIGTISAVGIGMTEPNYKNHFQESNKIALRKEIRKARSMTDGVLGVNIMLAISDYEDLLRIVLEEKVDVVFVGAGLPLQMPKSIPISMLENTKFIPKVSSAKAARLIFEYWSNKHGRVPDAVVVEGPKSGGHQGFKKENIDMPKNNLSNIVAETVAVIRQYEIRTSKEIPVIAGGGIYSGRDMFDIMQAGAKAVKMGTKFVTTHECDAHVAFKENYLNCAQQDIVLINSPVGLPGRVIRNQFVDQIISGQEKPINCPWKCLKTCNYKTVPFCIAEALFNAAKGNLDEGFSFAGTNAYLATKITSVKETVEEIMLEYNQLTRLQQLRKNLAPAEKILVS